MKLFFTFLLFVTAMSLGACRQSPKTLTEKYMALVCKDHRLHQAFENAETDKEREDLQKKCDRIHKQIDKLNAQILAKYQSDEQAMEIIREVIANYQCKDE